MIEVSCESNLTWGFFFVENIAHRVQKYFLPCAFPQKTNKNFPPKFAPEKTFSSGSPKQTVHFTQFPQSTTACIAL